MLLSETPKRNKCNVHGGLRKHKIISFKLFLTSECIPILHEWINLQVWAWEECKRLCGSIVSLLDTRQDVAVLIIVIFYRLEVDNISSGSQSFQFKVSEAVCDTMWPECDITNKNMHDGDKHWHFLNRGIAQSCAAFSNPDFVIAQACAAQCYH